MVVVEYVGIMRAPRLSHSLVVAIAACAGLAGCGSTAAGNGSRSATTTRSDPSSTVSASSTNVSFVVNGTTTYGTLEIPAHRNGQRLAAALLIPGSGPTDRNGNDVRLGETADTLQLIAAILARQGIMTLRYDKYFTGQTGGGRYANDPQDITVTAFERQAIAAYSFLRAQPQADPAKMLVAGHSEGGMVALLVADAVADKPVGLALLEPQDERILGLVELQTDETIDSAAAQGKLSVAQARRNGQAVQRAISQFAAGEPVSTTGMAPLVVQVLAPEILTADNARYVRSDNAISPPALAARIARGTRVLVTDGTQDPNVPPSTIGPLARALNGAGASGPGLRLLQGTDHYMHLNSQPDTQAVLAPAAIDAIKQWAQPFTSTPAR